MLRAIVCASLLLITPLALAMDNAAQHLQQLLTSYRTYQANFVQRTMSEDSTGHRQSSGTVLLQRPGRFRWETKQPMEQLIIANGQTLWIYDKDLQQVTQQSLNRRTGTDPAALLTGNVAELIKEFSIVELGGEVFLLKPKDRNEIFQEVRLKFADGKLVALQIKNNLGQTSQFFFSNIVINKSFDQRLFQFTPPAGVDVLKQ